MKSRRYSFIKVGLLLPAFWLAAGCSTIDDDLSDCGNTFELNYQLRLVTNMTTELKTQLTTMTEVSVANALTAHLKDIFTDFAHDVDLSFYDTENNQPRLQHDQHIMDANQQSYTINLPKRQYKHLAVANVLNNSVVSLLQDDFCRTSQLGLTTRDTIDSHTTGLFTARLPMNVLEGVDQQFKVNLYMANCAATLVLDPKGHTFKDIRVYATGFAKEFHISDSTYVFPANSPLIKADKVETGNDLLCFCSVNFPSPDAAPASSAKRRADEETPLWQIKVYLTKTDDSVTETVLDITEPLKAGNLKIIKGALDDEGAVRPYDSTVGVSVTLDWNKGGTYDPEL